MCGRRDCGRTVVNRSMDADGQEPPTEGQEASGFSAMEPMRMRNPIRRPASALPGGRQRRAQSAAPMAAVPMTTNPMAAALADRAARLRRVTRPLSPTKMLSHTIKPPMVSFGTAARAMLVNSASPRPGFYEEVPSALKRAGASGFDRAPRMPPCEVRAPVHAYEALGLLVPNPGAGAFSKGLQRSHSQGNCCPVHSYERVRSPLVGGNTFGRHPKNLGIDIVNRTAFYQAAPSSFTKKGGSMSKAKIRTLERSSSCDIHSYEKPYSSLRPSGVSAFGRPQSALPAAFRR